MARRRYAAWNGTTGSLTSITDLSLTTAVAPTSPPTASNGATQLQLLPGNNIAVIEWGYELSAIPTAATYVELLTTGTGAATVTAFGSTDIVNYDDASAAASACTLSTTGSGYHASAEGTFGTTRLLDQGPSWSQFYCKQFPLDREPNCISGNILRIRAYSATAINIRCYIVWEE